MVIWSAYANICMLFGVFVSSSFNGAFTYTLNEPVPIDEPCFDPEVMLFSCDNFPSTLTNESIVNSVE